MENKPEDKPAGKPGGEGGGLDMSGGKLHVFSLPSTQEFVELEKDTLRHLHKLTLILERMRLSEYIAMLQNTKRLIFLNFIAGLSRGFGFIIGMTLLMTLALLVLSKMVDLPLIGTYIAKIVHIVQQELSKK